MSASGGASAPFVSVIIPVFNNAATLGSVLEGLARQSYPPERYEVLVVDNRSSDGSAELARAHGVRLLAETARQSAYAARNRGIAAARGDVLAFLDGDCVPEPAWLGAGVAALEREGAGLAGGRIEIRAAGDRALLAHYERLSYVRQAETIAAHGTSAGGNLFLRRAVIDAAGPFREDLVSGGDSEICLRARRHGFRIAYAEDAVVTHRAVGSVRSLLRRYRRLGRGEADLARHGVAPVRAPGSSPWSRKRAYLRRVWREPGLTAGQRLAIVLLNLAAGVAQGVGYLEGRRTRRPAAGGPGSPGA